MRAILPIVFLMVLSAVEGSNDLHASTQAGRSTLTPVDLVNSFFRKKPKRHSQSEQQAAAATTHAGDVKDLDALMDESETPENREESATGDEGLDTAADEAMQASEAESLDEDAALPSRTKATFGTKAEGQKKKPKTKKQKGTVQEAKQSNRKGKKAQKGKNVPIIITIEPSGDMHLEVPNARIVKGRS